MSAKGPTPFNSIYAATKYGLAGFTHSLRVELHGTGVHAGVVCPGFVSEGMWGRTGLKAPAVLKEVTAGQVVRGVMKAMGGAGEVLVTAGPVRPLLALFQMFPGLEGMMMRRTGVVRVLAERAELAESGDS
ncbi:short-chain dehydrogenase [Plesiocystis pacifica SIR-1]|uniref:Short-chain dehydrogenase n=1 Tax=Plesiocystis pacifica SIR-1 TaxID=391625 RepID=A6G602_9BACT|nr:short-chain dehydrogenase [Plesiocystis pacifica SIR-1]